MGEILPGLNPDRLVNLSQQAINRCNLSLKNAVVLTEAATGAYVVTPIIAAMAGAKKVFAITDDSPYGTTDEVKTYTRELAKIAGVENIIEFIFHKNPEIIAQADIVTNSGHVRPIHREMIASMKSTAVIGLMYEAWEFRPEDIDLKACRERGIAIAGVNERHESVDVFSFLGIMTTKLLLDAGIAVYKSNIMLLCDNPFSCFIERGLINVGAKVDTFVSLAAASEQEKYDAIVVALQPQSKPVLSFMDAQIISKCWQGAVVAQFWGDVDRSALASFNIPICPKINPKPGHMGILPSGVGPEPIIRLQTGGLKAAEVIWRQFQGSGNLAMEFVQLL